MNKIWCKRPWTIADSLLILKRWDGRDSPERVTFSTADLWVHIHNIPMDYKTQENVKVIASSLFCTYITVEKKGVINGVWTPFVRVHAEIDISQPLLNMFALPIKGSTRLIELKYEKVPEYCTFCGRIGHELDECEIREQHIREGRSGSPSGFFSQSIKAGSQPRDLQDILHHLTAGWMPEESQSPAREAVPEDLGATAPWSGSSRNHVGSIGNRAQLPTDTPRSAPSAELYTPSIESILAQAGYAQGL
ncbi:hypothetical protein LINGRAHAP2_LOCUS28481 [Linum grandiflorum]